MISFIRTRTPEFFVMYQPDTVGGPVTATTNKRPWPVGQVRVSADDPLKSTLLYLLFRIAAYRLRYPNLPLMSILTGLVYVRAF
jgi:hypothetical protein